MLLATVYLKVIVILKMLMHRSKGFPGKFMQI